MSDDLLESHELLRKLVADLRGQRDAAQAAAAHNLAECTRVQVQRDRLRELLREACEIANRTIGEYRVWPSADQDRIAAIVKELTP